MVQGHRYEVQYRYETWLQYLTRRPIGHVDLKPLADTLSALEPGDTRWTFDGVEAIAPVAPPDRRRPGRDERDPARSVPRRRDPVTDRATNAWDPD